MKRISIFTVLIILCFFNSAFGEVRLPAIIGDGMVLQRNAHLRLWGWATPGESVTVRFLNNTYPARTNAKGGWEVFLDDLQAGGPFEMEIKGNNLITLRDILVGDVWLCSGQSNMELPMARVSPLYEKEIAGSDNVFIRQFAVPQHYNFNYPDTDLKSGSWVSANPKTVLRFSAVAYFFAKEIYDLYKVPVGIINTSLGGSPVEAWMSEQALKQFPEYYQEAQRFKDSSLIHKIEKDDYDRSQAWYSQLSRTDLAFTDPKGKWSGPIHEIKDWGTIRIPGYWKGTALENINGAVWFRKRILVPDSLSGKPAKLLLGRIVDADSVFLNGNFIGTTSYQYPPRRYTIPENILKAGENELVVRVISNIGIGGFVPDKPYELTAGKLKIDLRGDWYYKTGCTMPPLEPQTFIRWKPEGLFNGMINPLVNYAIKGVIWYQGESNTNKADEYKFLLPAMINDWRKSWNQDHFPFLIVQLANFMETQNQPSESNWALLREGQLKTLHLPETGMAVTIDLGEWNDIHPLNKKEVGKRLAIAARKTAYGENLTGSGPLFKNMVVSKNKAILSFDHVGNGLTINRGKELKYFSVAGPDHIFVWAKAVIKNDKVIVWNSKVKIPAAVRYAWADNPEGANLYNKEGLPASPFRTDDFPAVVNK